MILFDNLIYICMNNSKYFVNCVLKDCKKNVIIYNELRLLVYILVVDWGKGE